MEGSSRESGWPLAALGLGVRSAPRVLVLGLARSGLAAARLLHARGARLRLLGLEGPSRPDLAARLQELVEAGADLRLGPHDPAALEDVDLVVKSPGVSSEIPFLVAARSQGVPIVGELEIAALAAAGPIVAITGTNGKSTTTAWVGHMLETGGFAPEVVGNIGRPFADGVLARPEATFVVEVSSFQLEDTRTFHPRVATLLNLTPDHLDRHHTMEAYAGAKARIFAQQNTDDLAVLGGGPELESFLPPLRARVLRTGEVPGGGSHPAPAGSGAAPGGVRAPGGARPNGAATDGSGVFLRGDTLVLRAGADWPEVRVVSPGGAVGEPRERAGAHAAQRAASAPATRPPWETTDPEEVVLLSRGELALPGAHNLENAMAAAATAAAAGAPIAAIVDSLRTFPGLAHRLENVGEVAGVVCVNDSKATNVDSLVVALRAFPERVHLIAGGVGKGQDFAPVAPLVRERTRSVHLIGESAEILASAWAGADLRRSDSLAAALDGALGLARPGERILLSPGCASFDMFRDFEDRGDQFRDLVADRARSRGGAA